ncbi:MAG: hypothetical protein AAGA67_03045 [Cyanobacteria bacterium P01_F01_bin.153]
MRTRNRRQSNSRDAGNSVHPVLQAALESLDVDLDRELARYRRSRPRPNGGVRRFWLGRSPESGQPEAVPVPEDANNFQPSLDGGALNGEQSAIAPFDDPNELVEQGDLHDAMTQRPAISQEPLPDPKAALENQPLETAALGQASALLKQTQNFANLGGVSAEDLPSPEAYAFPSVREQRAAESKKRRGNWFSGTGVATILMMTAGTVWTYYANYPDSDQYLQVAQVFEAIANVTGLDALDPATVATGDSGVEPAGSAPVEDSASVPGPDLSNQEFVGLDLESLSVLGENKPSKDDAEVLANTTISGLPAVTELPGDGIAGTQPQSSDGEESQPEDKDEKKDSQAALEITEIPSDGTGYFYVVEPYKTNNPGDREALLAQARQYVPDAYVRSLAGELYIQFAALDKRDQAETMAKRLLGEGLTIQILHPKATDAEN